MPTLTVTLLAAALQGAAAEPPAAPTPIPVSEPAWRIRPTSQDVERVYPRDARRQRVNGRVVMECKVTAEGDMRDCVVLGEAPDDHGFGEAALKLSTKFRLRPTLPDGKSVENGTVRIPMQFVGPWSR